ncbi:NtaA/DmoA family FMN-dependent monooxygenase [Mycolicibacterium sp.]|uniref:NtaA/DmoA family FMN-dependent monooxygenase n=1 Tax=Mycolicibacterium sp. TaxID=2320850 RepID=UPI00355DC855
MAREILLNAFSNFGVASYAPGLWRHPEDKSANCTDISYWVELAEILERGGIDSLFLSDVLAAPNLEGREAGLRSGVGVPAGDPFTVIPAMAAVTDNLGFVVTGNVGYEHPFLFARRMSTLDHLTNGRIGWNIVTSSAFFTEDKGVAGELGSADRYQHADEYAEVCYRLWEGSWADDAVVRDHESGVHTRTDRIFDIDHASPHYQLHCLHQCAPSPQRTPVLFQAGVSAEGRGFASRHAEAILTGSLPRELVAMHVASVRQQAAEFGRDPRAVKCFAAVLIITAASDELAQEKYQDYIRYADAEGGRFFASTVMALDLTQFDWDMPVAELRDKVERPIEWFIREKLDGSPWTIRDLAITASVGLGAETIIGSPSTVADELQSWVDATDLDGFNLIAVTTPGTYADIVEHVIPELRRRGVYKQDYTPGTYRNKLTGRGDRLPVEHPAALYRVG